MAYTDEANMNKELTVNIKVFKGIGLAIAYEDRECIILILCFDITIKLY